MHPRFLLIIPAAALATALALPTPSSAQCTGVAEIFGNDMTVSAASSDIESSFYAQGPNLFVVWNESGSTPVVHQGGQYKAVWNAGTLLHEIGHTIGLDHGGPVVTAADQKEVIFVASDNGRLYKVDAKTGAALASVDTRRAICSDDAIAATPAVQLYAYSNPAFQSAMLAERGRPDDLVYVVTHHGCGDPTGNQVIAYYASDLTLKWRFNSTASYSMDYGMDGCEVDASTNQIYCATHQGLAGQNTLWALQALPPTPGGGLVWSSDAGSLVTRPRITPGELYLTRADGTILKLNPSTGSTVWTLPNSSPIGRNIWPEFRAPLPTRIYYTTGDGLLHATVDNFPSPVPLWPPVSPGPGIKFVGTPVCAPSAGKLYVGRDDGKVQQISLASGSLEATEVVADPGTLWDSTLDRSSAGASDPDRLLVTTTTGGIKRYCIPWLLTTSVARPTPASELALALSTPNPFTRTTRIAYGLPYDTRVEIDLYDVGGRRVRTLLRGPQRAGPHDAIWDGLDDDGRAVGSGPYFYRLRMVDADGRSIERSNKIVLLH